MTEQSILDYLLSQAIQPLDEATEINIAVLTKALGALNDKQATHLIDRLVIAGELEPIPVKRRCPITGKPSRAWRRVGMVENTEAG